MNNLNDITPTAFDNIRNIENNEIRGIFIRELLLYILNNKIIISRPSAKTARDCIQLSDNRYKAVRKKVKKQICSYLFKDLRPNAKQLFENPEMEMQMLLYIDNFKNLDQDTQANRIFNGLVQNITTDEVVTTNEEQNKDLEETKKRLIKYLDECKAANREQATPEQEQEQPPAAEQEQPTPEREQPKNIIMCSAQEIKRLNSGWFEPTPPRQQSEQIPATKQETPPQTEIEKEMRELFAGTENTEQPAELPATIQQTIRYADLTKYAADIINYYCQTAQTDYKRYIDNGGNPAEFSFEFNPYKIMKASNATKGSEQVAQYYNAVKDLNKTSLSFVTWQATKGNKTYTTVKTVNFIRSYTTEYVTDETGIKSEKITQIQLDDIFYTDNKHPVMPVKKLFPSGKYSGKLTAGEVGAAVSWIVNRYEQNTRVEWNSIFDKFSFADSNTRRVKGKIYANLQTRGFEIVEKNPKYFKFKR